VINSRFSLVSRSFLGAWLIEIEQLNDPAQRDKLGRAESTIVHNNIVSDDAISVPETDDWLEILQEEHTPLEQFWPDEFRRYQELFIKYLPKTPFHVRTRYDGDFIRQKGRKNNGEEFCRGCYPGLIAKMLDHERWRRVQYHRDPEKEETRYAPDYWIALYSGSKSRINAIDFDNKENVLGHYYESPLENARPRPLVTLTLDHLQAMKRLYDEFPNRIWCISSLTLGLHIWEMNRFPKSIELIHAVAKPRLKTIGLGNTEIHPMFGRLHRRPFGKDYFTITETGILEEWIEQLNYFENVAKTPSFDAIYHSLRSKVKDILANYRRDGGHGFKGFASPQSRPHLQKYCVEKNYVNMRDLEEDLKLCDQWAEQGFPATIAATVPVVMDLNRLPVKVAKTAPKCDVTLSQVCNREWVQNCEKWAIEGLPCHNSILLVVSQLARWFYFIELWEIDENERIDRIISLLTDYCLKKNNGFISRLEIGLKADVTSHVCRIVKMAVAKTDSQGKMFFSNVRLKRKRHEYHRIIYLEPVIASSLPVGFTLCCTVSGDDAAVLEQDDKASSFPVGCTLCCSVVPLKQTPKEKREAANNWEYEADDSPLPAELEKRILDYYYNHGVKCYKPTIKNLTRLINHLWKTGGEARVGVQLLKKMGFANYSARQHVKRLEEMGIITASGYCPAAATSKAYKLSKRTMGTRLSRKGFYEK